MTDNCRVTIWLILAPDTQGRAFPEKQSWDIDALPEGKNQVLRIIGRLEYPLTSDRPDAILREKNETYAILRPVHET